MWCEKLCSIWPLVFPSDHLKPLCDLVIDVIVMSVPIQRLDSLRTDLGIAIEEGSRPVLAWSLELFVNRGA